MAVDSKEDEKDWDDDLFRYNHNKVKLLCFGFVRQSIGFMQFYDIANIIFDYSKISSLNFIHNELYSQVQHITSETLSKKTVAGLRCNFNKQPHDTKFHSSSTILIKPFISTLLDLPIVLPNTTTNNDNNNKTNINCSGSTSSGKKSIKLTIKLKSKKCQSYKYRYGGYLLQCGILCVPREKIIDSLKVFQP